MHISTPIVQGTRELESLPPSCFMPLVTSLYSSGSLRQSTALMCSFKGWKILPGVILNLSVDFSRFRVKCPEPSIVTVRAKKWTKKYLETTRLMGTHLLLVIYTL